jgi:hypothetical protein
LLVQCATIFCYSELMHFATVLNHYIILSAILDRGCAILSGWLQCSTIFIVGTVLSHSLL